MHSIHNHIKYKYCLTTTLYTASLFLCALFLFNNNAQAATLSGLTAMPPPVEYIVIPETPGAGENVNIQVNGVGSFIGESQITWTQEGKAVATGVGLRNFSFSVGGFGSQTNIGVVIKTAQHGTITNQWTFNPSLVNLVWEAHTTVPPFYDGKALASPGSSITVTAFPVVIYKGVRQSSKKLSFQWRFAGDLQADKSGLGYDSFAFPSKQIHAREDVSVEVLLNDGNTKVAWSSITVPVVEPKLLLYQHDPLRGVLYDRVLGLGGNFSMLGNEVTLRAEPYFFSIESAARGSLEYRWQLNGDDASGPNSAQGELTLRQTGSGQGAADINVSLQNNDNDKILQGARLVAQILFGGSKQGGIF